MNVFNFVINRNVLLLFCLLFRSYAHNILLILIKFLLLYSLLENIIVVNESYVICRFTQGLRLNFGIFMMTIGRLVAFITNISLCIGKYFVLNRSVVCYFMPAFSVSYFNQISVINCLCNLNNDIDFTKVLSNNRPRQHEVVSC